MGHDYRMRKFFLPIGFLLSALLIATASLVYFLKTPKTECDHLYQTLAYSNNPAEAVPFDKLTDACQQAVQQFPDAARYAYFYGKALTLSEDYQHAIEYFQQAAQSDYAPSYYELGIIHLYGLGVNYDPEIARSWLSRSARAGYAPAQYQLAEMYLTGEGGGRDKTQAIDWLQQAAEQSFVEAQYRLGMVYRNNHSDENNKENAIYWLKKAAETDHANAQYVLANEYLRGQIVKQDYFTATELLQKAADNGYGTAEQGFFSNAFCSEVSAAIK